MADLCERLGADVHDVARGMGLDQRIGRKFLHPGLGYGGSCFPKDTRAIMWIAEEQGIDLRVIGATVAVNDERPAKMLEKIRAAFGGTLRGKTVAQLGLTFKPNTDDMRESPALAILDAHGRGGRHRARLRSRRHAERAGDRGAPASSSARTSSRPSKGRTASSSRPSGTSSGESTPTCSRAG